MTDAFLLWKVIHVLSATVLLGTGAGIAYFCWFGYRSAMRAGQIEALRGILRLTVVADAWLTAPAVVIQALSGIVLMHLRGWDFSSPWSIVVWTLFALVGMCWGPVVAIQIGLSRQASKAASIVELPAEFHHRFRYWFLLGVPAFAMVVMLVFLMVAKPLPVE